MKQLKLLWVIGSVLSSISLFAQDKDPRTYFTRFGIMGGVNFSTQTNKGAGVTIPANSNVNPIGGLFLSLPLGTSGFHVQPELLWNDLGAESAIEKLDMSYLAVPLLAKMSFGKNGFGAYLGPQVGFLMAARNTPQGGSSGNVKPRYKGTDIAGVVGVEYVLPIRLLVSARYQLGLTNILKNDVATNGITVKNNAATVTIGYRIR
jgi:hypothetical protein